MVKVDANEAVHTLSISGKLGFPWGFGRIWFGVSRFGDDYEPSGIYRRRPTRAGQITIRQNFYWPVNTLSPELQANRLTFAQGVAAWQALTEEQKDFWRALPYPENMSGYNRYLSLWLKS